MILESELNLLFQTRLETISAESRGGKIVHSDDAAQFAKYSQNIVRRLIFSNLILLL